MNFKYLNLHFMKEESEFFLGSIIKFSWVYPTEFYAMISSQKQDGSHSKCGSDVAVASLHTR